MAEGECWDQVGSGLVWSGAGLGVSVGAGAGAGVSTAG